MTGAATKGPNKCKNNSAATAVLATDYAKLITGETVYVDAGYHIVG